MPRATAFSLVAFAPVPIATLSFALTEALLPIAVPFSAVEEDPDPIAVASTALAFVCLPSAVAPNCFALVDNRQPRTVQ